MNNNYNKNIGNYGEEVAAYFLFKKGFSILFRNFRSKRGEIDIICKKKGVIYFIEVKTVARETGYSPYDNVSREKIRKINTTIKYFFSMNIRYLSTDYKIGVIAIYLERFHVKRIEYLDNVIQ